MKEPVLKNKNKCVKAKKIAGLALSVALGANSIFFGINALNSRKNADKFLDKYKAESKAYAEYVAEDQAKAYRKYLNGELTKAELEVALRKELTQTEIVYILMNSGEQDKLEEYNSLTKDLTADEAVFAGAGILAYATAKLTANYINKKKEEQDENDSELQM